MNRTAAQSIAKCISIIAQDAAKIAVIDYESHKTGMNTSLGDFRAGLVRDIERHEESIIRWLTLYSTNNDTK